jgi:hypothetical protein
MFLLLLGSWAWLMVDDGQWAPHLRPGAGAQANGKAQLACKGGHQRPF